MSVSGQPFSLSPLYAQAAVRAEGIYMCLPCDVQFDYSAHQTNCPSCSTESRQDLSALYIEENAEQAEFLMAFDFGEGD